MGDFSIGLVIWQLLVLLAVLLPILALISILKNNFLNNEKLVWVLVVLFVPLVGAILYFIIGRPKRLLKKEAI